MLSFVHSGRGDEPVGFAGVLLVLILAGIVCGASVALVRLAIRQLLNELKGDQGWLVAEDS